MIGSKNVKKKLGGMAAFVVKIVLILYIGGGIYVAPPSSPFIPINSL